MAIKNFIMHNYNGSEYNELHPKTSIPQVEGLEESLRSLGTNKINLTMSAKEPTNSRIGDFWLEIPPNFLTFTASHENSSITLKGRGEATWTGYIKKNNSEWEPYTLGTYISLLPGETVSFKGIAGGISYWDGSLYFSMSGIIAASGNIMSLWFGDDYEDNTAVPEAYGYRLFRNCSSLISAPELPATAVGEDGYSRMFYNCTSLTLPPKLPASIVGKSGYSSMFKGCTSLKISDTQSEEYTIPYRIPSKGDGQFGDYALDDMFYDTGGTFTHDPTPGTTYYICDYTYTPPVE